MNLRVTNEFKQFKTTPQIDGDISSTKNAKLKKASHEFESLLTSMLINTMMKSTSGMFGDNSMGGDFFSSIFQNQLADKISSGKGLGIADLIYKKVSEKLGNEIEKKDDLNLSPDKIQMKDYKQPLKITPSDSSVSRLNKFENIIDDAASEFGVDKNVIKSVILAESGGNEKAVSKANAKGLMQLMDFTANKMGVENVWDPKDNIFGGTKYLSQMLRQYNGDLKLALASYNAGPGNVDKFDGIPPFEETKTYVNRVLGYLNHFNE